MTRLNKHAIISTYSRDENVDAFNATTQTTEIAPTHTQVVHASLNTHSQYKNLNFANHIYFLNNHCMVCTWEKRVTLIKRNRVETPSTLHYSLPHYIVINYLIYSSDSRTGDTSPPNGLPSFHFLPPQTGTEQSVSVLLCIYIIYTYIELAQLIFNEVPTKLITTPNIIHPTTRIIHLRVYMGARLYPIPEFFCLGFIGAYLGPLPSATHRLFFKE